MTDQPLFEVERYAPTELALTRADLLRALEAVGERITLQARMAPEDRALPSALLLLASSAKVAAEFAIAYHQAAKGEATKPEGAGA